MTIFREKYSFKLFVVVSLIAALIGLIVLFNLPFVSKSKVLILTGTGIGIILCCLLLTSVVTRRSHVTVYKRSLRTYVPYKHQDTRCLVIPPEGTLCAYCLCEFEPSDKAVAVYNQYLVHKECSRPNFV
jgi:hypothetical protein